MNSFFTLISALFISLHPLHVSVTEIEYDEKDKALEIMMRVFMDDFELTMRNYYRSPDLDVTAPKDKSVDQMMAQYLKENWSVRLDGKLQASNYLGHEREGDAFIFFIEVPKIKKWKKINIRNSILMETHEDQSNLVHVTSHEKIKSLRLTKSDPAGELSF